MWLLKELIAVTFKWLLCPLERAHLSKGLSHEISFKYKRHGQTDHWIQGLLVII
jgi:hypothetical protein